ncbi:hypothetical protein FQN60_004449, partial [Etheostoma spectabile]
MSNRYSVQTGPADTVCCCFKEEGRRHSKLERQLTSVHCVVVHPYMSLCVPVRTGGRLTIMTDRGLTDVTFLMETVPTTVSKFRACTVSDDDINSNNITSPDVIVPSEDAHSEIQGRRKQTSVCMRDQKSHQNHIVLSAKATSW